MGSVKTDAEGAYRFLVPSEGTGFYFFAVPPGYVRPDGSSRRPLNALPGETHKPGFDYTLKADAKAGRPVGFATVKGHVLDLDGNPLKGVEVSDSREYDPGEKRSVTMSRTTKSGEDGQFSLMITAVGKHSLRVGGKGYSFNQSEIFVPKKDALIELPDIQVVLYTGTLSGTLTDSAGTALSRVQMYLGSDDTGPRETESDSNGEFVFEHVPDGPLRLFHMKPIQDPLYKDFYQEVEAGFHYTIVLSYIDELDEER